jgi:signal transduction histidine kinase
VLALVDAFDLGGHIRNEADPVACVPHCTAIAEIRDLLEELSTIWSCSVDLQVNAEEEALPPELGEQVLLMLREAVANAVKHGHAKRISISLTQSADSVRLSITDDGIGFPGLKKAHEHDALQEPEAGPVSLRERVKALGGNLTISTLSAGTELEIELPLQPDELQQ